jgi:uncharacterized OsmC-like protein
MTTEVTNRLNNVDIETVGGLIGAIQEDDTRAHTTWKANVKWHGAFRSSASIRDFDPVHSDEPAGLGGHDTAPNPVEQLLAALGNCLAVGYAANATAAGIELTDLEIDLEGDLNLQTFLGLDDDGHAGYHAIRASVRLDADATEEQIDALHERVIGTSPVGHTLRRPIDVAIDIDFDRA